MTGSYRNHSLRLLSFVGMASLLSVGLAAEPLAERVDLAVSARAGEGAGEPAAIVDDAGFLRRLHLDLVGVIPTADEVRAFFADTDPEKRNKAIERLLGDARYARHMRDRFHTMLMERLGEDETWLSWLQTSFEQNKPWDQMVREILAADPGNEQARGAAFFVTKRLESYGQNPVDFAGLTRDVGRLFIGKDLQCAQCHDDLFVDDYEQLDFQGLHVVFSNLEARRDGDFPAVAEKPLRDKLEFVSVFDPTQRVTGPRLPGAGELILPTASGEADAEDQRKRDEKTPERPPVALGLFAKELPTASYRPFVHNIANRLWFLMMGRGLIHPLDLHHSGNPPSHPELLDEISSELASHAFDIKWMLGELARSKTYQRSSAADQEHSLPPAESFLVFNEKRLSSEQLLWSLLTATGESTRYREGEQETAPAEGLAPLKELREQFITAFANPPREPEDEINVGVKGALFLLNNERVLQLLERREGNLIDRLMNMEAADKIAEELYLSILSRYPSQHESHEVAQLLESERLDREEILRQAAWALIASIEFYVNH